MKIYCRWLRDQDQKGANHVFECKSFMAFEMEPEKITFIDGFEEEIVPFKIVTDDGRVLQYLLDFEVE